MEGLDLILLSVARSLDLPRPRIVDVLDEQLLARAFYALNDIKTPMKISVVCLLLNLGFSVWLVHYIAKPGWHRHYFSAISIPYCSRMPLRRKLTRLGWAKVVYTLLVLIPPGSGGNPRCGTGFRLGEQVRPCQSLAETRRGFRAGFLGRG